ncbi:hypothetical protein MRX96_020506 [Rhipicephalus microplus]
MELRAFPKARRRTNRVRLLSVGLGPPQMQPEISTIGGDTTYRQKAGLCGRAVAYARSGTLPFPRHAAAKED